MGGCVRVGIGGWTYPPWRGGVFFPTGLPHAQELHHASRRLTSIEINGTFYRTQTPATFAKWAADVPDDFVFAVKAPRYATNKRVLAEARDSIARFATSGLAELGAKLGPILWQFAATKRFDAADFAAFLALLPRGLGGRPLRHALEVRHPSFVCDAFVNLARGAGCAIVLADSDDYPLIDTPTADFTYARLMRNREDVPTGYPPAELTAWRARFDAAAVQGRDVFAFFIAGGKEHAPAAALALLAMQPSP